MMETTHLQAQSDHTLLLGTAAGEYQAFEALYERYHSRVYQYLRMKTQDDTEAEEILTEVMVAVWRGAQNFKGDSQVSTWIFGIARHKVLDAIRKKIRYDVNIQSLAENQRLLDHSNTLKGQLVLESSAAFVQEALTKLSQEHQEILYLAFYEEMSYQEIANLIGAPMNTVKTRVFYAKKKLKDVLASLGFS